MGNRYTGIRHHALADHSPITIGQNPMGLINYVFTGLMLYDPSLLKSSHVINFLKIYRRYSYEK